MLIQITKNGAILGLVALISTGLVSLTHFLTKDPIAEQQKQHLLEVLNQIIPPRIYNNALYDSCTLVIEPSLGTYEKMPLYIATRNGKPTALAIEAIAPDGYSGNIRILVAVGGKNHILGVRTLQHSETPGLGDKIDLNVSDWILSFTLFKMEGRDDPRWAIRKEGGAFDQFTGATITPRAVINAAKKAAFYLITHQKQLVRLPPNCGKEK